MEYREKISKGETKLHKYLEKNWKKIFPYFKIIESNPAIYGFYSNNRIGIADLLVRRGKQCYIIEIKYGNNKSLDLWSSFKAIGYAKAHEIYTGFSTKPVIMIEKSIITNDIKTILYGVGLNYITFEHKKDGYFFEYDFGNYR